MALAGPLWCRWLYQSTNATTLTMDAGYWSDDNSDHCEGLGNDAYNWFAEAKG